MYTCIWSFRLTFEKCLVNDAGTVILTLIDNSAVKNLARVMKFLKTAFIGKIINVLTAHMLARVPGDLRSTNQTRVFSSSANEPPPSDHVSQIPPIKAAGST